MNPAVGEAAHSDGERFLLLAQRALRRRWAFGKWRLLLFFLTFHSFLVHSFLIVQASAKAYAS
jgi:hypothetical protein